jgi:hypothetical protein
MVFLPGIQKKTCFCINFLTLYNSLRDMDEMILVESVNGNCFHICKGEGTKLNQVESSLKLKCEKLERENEVDKKEERQ